MGFHDPHAILLNRSSILVVTSVGVALLTLSYVLGVQVGKQSGALQRPTSKGSGEDLKALQAPIQEQLKAIDAREEEPPAKPDPNPAVKSDAKPEARVVSKDDSKPMPATPTPAGAARWTLQLLSTPDQTEADRAAAKAKAAGYPAQVVKGNGVYKVRWNHTGTKTDVDATATKMKAAGFRPFAVPVE